MNWWPWKSNLRISNHVKDFQNYVFGKFLWIRLITLWILQFWWRVWSDNIQFRYSLISKMIKMMTLNRKCTSSCKNSRFTNPVWLRIEHWLKKMMNLLFRSSTALNSCACTLFQLSLFLKISHNIWQPCCMIYLASLLSNWMLILLKALQYWKLLHLIKNLFEPKLIWIWKVH